MITLNHTSPGCTRISTNFGFIVIREPEQPVSDIEAYGMSGYGRYEHIFTVGMDPNPETLAEQIWEFAEDHGYDEAITNVYIPTKQALHAPTWHYDERIRCVAVYKGPKRECLNGISRHPDCVYFKCWSEHTATTDPQWVKDILIEAKRIHNALTGD